MNIWLIIYLSVCCIVLWVIYLRLCAKYDKAREKLKEYGMYYTVSQSFTYRKDGIATHTETIVDTVIAENENEAIGLFVKTHEKEYETSIKQSNIFCNKVHK